MKAVTGSFSIIPFVIMLLSFTSIDAQDSSGQKFSVNKQQDIINLVISRSYVFEVQTVLPLAGSPVIVTPDYSLSVTPNKIVSNLPYFGRAYVAPVNPDDSGIEFSSDDFTYNEENKNNGWQIQIKPVKQKVQQMTLTISENGYANLTVISSDRQQISYRGIIRKHRERSTSLL